MRVRQEQNSFQKFCVKNDLTAEQVGAALGISKHTVYSYFSGERLPSRRTMKRFKEVFKIDPSEVFNYEIKN